MCDLLSDVAHLTDKQRSNCVEFEGYLYATLDFAAPSSRAYGEQQDYVALPADWEIAPETEAIVRHVIAPNGWNAAALHVQGALIGTASWVDHEGQRIESSRSTLYMNDGRFKPSENERILIRTQACKHSVVEHRAMLGSCLWEQRLFTDCTISVSGEHIKCHRAVLAYASPVFRRMFESDMREAAEQVVEMSDVEPQVVEAMLTFIYTGHVKLDEPQLVNLFCIADRYELETLMLAVLEPILRHVNSENVLPIIRALRNVSSRPMFEHAWKRLCSQVKEDQDLWQQIMMSA